MDLSTPAAELVTSLTSNTTGIPALIGDMAPLIALGVVISLFFGLLGRALH